MARLRRVHYRIIDAVLAVLVVAAVIGCVYGFVSRKSAKTLFDENTAALNALVGDDGYDASLEEYNSINDKLTAIEAQIAQVQQQTKEVESETTDAEDKLTEVEKFNELAAKYEKLKKEQ